MGCDGGTIPTRDELVKLKKKPEKKDSDGHRLYKWQHCALSQEPLRKPVVCQMGRLYNKEAVIELLLSKDRSGAPSWSKHLEKLKDVIELQVTANPAYDGSRVSVGDGGYNDRLISPWICPVTGLEMNGRFKFVFSWPGGKAVAERAVKVMQQDPAEAENFKEEDLVMLNPEDDDIDLMHSKMVTRKAKAKAEKKAKKKQSSGEASTEGEPVEKKKKMDDSKKTDDKSKVKSSSKFNMFAEQARREKAEDARPVKERGAVSSVQLAKTVADSKKKSVQEGNGSEIFKRLFTTHETAQNLPKGNWVTFDPRYN